MQKNIEVFVLIEFKTTTIHALWNYSKKWTNMWLIGTKGILAGLGRQIVSKPKVFYNLPWYKTERE